jgi:hypothetical protein
VSEDVGLGQWKWRRLAVLGAIFAVQVVAVLYDLHFFTANGYLPAPFVFDKHDTFMDFFHPTFWATQEDRYSDWGSVYPPLIFLVLALLRWILMGEQYFADAFALRQGAVGLEIFLVLAYFLAAAFVLTRNYWRQFTALEKILIYGIAVCSAPFLFALERGNLVIFSFFLLPFLFMGSPVARMVSLALLVNLKPYFVLLFLGYIIKRRWDELLVALGIAGGLYLLTGVLLGSDPLAMPLNLLNFSQQNNLFSPRAVLDMPSSVSMFSYVLGSDTFQKSSWFDLFPEPALIVMLIEIVKWGVIASASAALLRAKDALPLSHIFAVLLVIITNVGVSVGGYTLIFYLALLPVFNEMRLRRVYLFLILMMAFPFDCLTLADGDVGSQLAYLSGAVVDVRWTLGAGSLMRPFLNLMLLAVVAWELMGRRWRVLEERVCPWRQDSSVPSLSQSGE